MKKGLFFLLTAGIMLNATTLDEQIVKGILPNTKINGVKKANSTFYVVCTDDTLLYVNAYDNLLFFGELWTNTGQSLTQKDVDWCKGLKEPMKLVKSNNDFWKLDEAKITDLKDNGLKIVNGKGSSEVQFIIFKSPVCGWCEKLTEEMEKMNVTSYEYYFMSPESEMIYKKYGVSNPKEMLKKQAELTRPFEQTLSAGVPLTLVIMNNKVVEVIKGADLPKFQKYM